MILLLMGVCGSGKSTIGKQLAKRLVADFIEGDDYHPPENISKMRSGEPLQDADRRQWLTQLAAILQEAAEQNRSLILACSALKASYRQQLLANCPKARIVWLYGSEAVIKQRVESRSNHFVSANLIASQFEILEPPKDAVKISITKKPEQIVEEILGCSWQSTSSQSL